MNSVLANRLEAAVVTLTGQGALKDRLCAAYCAHLEDIDELDLPEDVQHEFTEMSKAMHRARALPGDTVVRASVRKLSNEEAQRFAGLIVRMYGVRMQNISAALKVPTRLTAPARAPAPLAALLSIDGGNAGSARAKHATSP